MMTNTLKRIIAKHYQLQYGCFFSNIQIKDNIIYTYNDVMHCTIWNHCCFAPDANDLKIDVLLYEAKEYLSTRGRTPCVYLDYDIMTEQMDLDLKKYGYKCVDNEAWMIYKRRYDKSPENVNYTMNMELVHNEETLDEFVKICSECFDCEYGLTVRREFHQYQPHKQFAHYIFSLNEIAVASVSVYYQNDFYFIHNVGVLGKYRRCGKAKEVMRMILGKIFEMNDTPTIVLQCDGGGYIENFYKNIGFELIHRRWGYTNDTKTGSSKAI